MPINLDEIRVMARDLPPGEKLSLIEELTRQLRNESPEAPVPSPRNPRGILARFGPAPSAEEIDEVRREMWDGFPRDIDVIKNPRSNDSARP